MRRTKKVVLMLAISCVLALLLIPLAGCQPVVVQGPAGTSRTDGTKRVTMTSWLSSKHCRRQGDRSGRC